jgi:alkylated DNA repair dioxygenase AlkB
MAELVAPEVERLDLGGGSWVDVGRGWLAPEAAVELYGALTEGLAWRQGRLFRYDHHVEEPRLSAWWAPGHPAPHPLLPELHRLVQRTWRRRFDGLALAWYRDGRDGQAFHADRDLRWLDDTLIVLLTLGATRPWLLRPKAARHDPDAPTRDLRPAAGDLLAMGGRTQRDWVHSVPKVAAAVEGRISLQWRWTSRQGRPERGPGYRAPRTFGRG